MQLSRCSGATARAQRAAPQRGATVAAAGAAAARGGAAQRCALAPCAAAPLLPRPQQPSQQPRGAAQALSAGPHPQQQPRRHAQQQQQQRQRRRHPSWVAADAPAPALATTSIEEDAGPSSLGPDAAQAVAYAMQLAWTAETYEVHPWMLLLALLKDESGPAARALGRAGLEDPYAAWHEVLWALNVSDGLLPRAFTARLDWAPGAYKIMDGAIRFAGWAGRDRVGAQDILLALAAAGTLESLFPDLSLDFQSVRRAVQKETGDAYTLPKEDPAEAAMQSQDLFL
ncbi:hypothetical protein Rsub_02905 [Raphidocelis subcapitata]|uniref:Clp R domain-containing protein n=1 Tax=Raphidocelis subcapitata TaxID=307507 RepID=A0A2V0NY26_9CHLO|nr:hypothetical protein Rsub_02905 [Raphidocelis subcapitata]|eukprot:GBF89735.1 hypothetical protein Rsub_02905 [Raphidocelis subcapitata]